MNEGNGSKSAGRSAEAGSAGRDGRVRRATGVTRPGDQGAASSGSSDAPACAACAQELQEPYGWCENCREAFCAACGPAHFCMPTCRAAGCHAGLCVRLVRNGAVVPGSWGMRG